MPQHSLEKPDKEGQGQGPLERIRLEAWELPTRHPTVLLAQLSTPYAEHQAPLLRPERHGRAYEHAYDRKLVATLDTALTQRAHFTVFSEYAWPAELASGIGERLKALPEGSACVLPFEHTPLSELKQLLQQVGVEEELRQPFEEEMLGVPGLPPLDLCYCNFLLFAVRAGGRLRFVPQAKLYPAEFEKKSRNGRRFIPGRRVRLIEGKNIKVATAICFDFIARDDDADTRPREVLHGGNRPDLFLVPECNPSPLHMAYAHGLVALFSDPAWARKPPFVLFANVAAGSRLAGIAPPAFGFSRVFGELGQLVPSEHPCFRNFPGVVVGKAPSLGELARSHQVLPHKKLRLLTLRTEESAVCLTLPHLETGATKDPENGQPDTHVIPLRYLPAEQRWRQIQQVSRRPLRPPVSGIPEDLLRRPRFETHTEAEQDLSRRLLRAAGPLWVVGPGGSGKTSLVARVLQQEAVAPGLARVVWLDLEGPEEGCVEQLQAALLLKLGRARAMALPSSRQWEVIEQELSCKPTVLVLDSFERWSGGEAGNRVPLPEELQRMSSGWLMRLVVTTRGEVPSGAERIELGLLDAAGTYAFLRAAAGVDAANALAADIHSVIGGMPLALTWVAGMLQSKILPGLIQEALKARAGGADCLEVLLHSSLSGLHDVALSILDVLAFLPAPVMVSDLVKILGEPEIQVNEALRGLGTRNLVLETGGSEGHRAVYGQHPFVRQFLRRDEARQEECQERVIQWGLRLMEEHGGDRRWSEYPLLWMRWPNLRFLLEWLARREEKTYQEDFLRGWRSVDYALWSGGNWHDRRTLGIHALRVAKACGAGWERHEAHAAYASMAETEWHQDQPVKNVIPYFQRAYTLLSHLQDSQGRWWVDYYRARLYHHRGEVQKALDIAKAVETAVWERDPQLHALLHVLMGRLLTEKGWSPWSIPRFQAARKYFTEQNNKEMLAVVDREEGRARLKEGAELGEALELLERSIRRFQELHLELEEAKAAIYHAQVLTGLGEREEARAELAWVKGILEELGARVSEDDDIKEMERQLQDAPCA